MRSRDIISAGRNRSAHEQGGRVEGRQQDDKKGQGETG